MQRILKIPKPKKITGAEYYCEQCQNTWKKLKQPACPRMSCQNRILPATTTTTIHDQQQQQHVRYKCENHGEMDTNIISHVSQCPATECHKHLKRMCQTCEKWLHATQYNRRMTQFVNNLVLDDCKMKLAHGDTQHDDLAAKISNIATSIARQTQYYAAYIHTEQFGLQDTCTF